MSASPATQFFWQQLEGKKQLGLLVGLGGSRRGVGLVATSSSAAVPMIAGKVTAWLADESPIGRIYIGVCVCNLHACSAQQQSTQEFPQAWLLGTGS
jgi:hypothetical protein